MHTQMFYTFKYNRKKCSISLFSAHYENILHMNLCVCALALLFRLLVGNEYTIRMP